MAENTRDQFQELVTKSALVAKGKETATGIRKLEFALMRLETSVDGHVQALQEALLNKLPVNIVSLVTLGNILRNLSLTLPQGYALAVDAASRGLIWYYQNVQASLITTTHGFLLVLAVPIKDVYRQYDLYKAYSFPREVTNGTFVKYQLEKAYLAIQALHHAYVLITEEELSKCPGREPKICATTVPIYGPEIDLCVNPVLAVDNCTGSMRSDGVHHRSRPHDGAAWGSCPLSLRWAKAGSCTVSETRSMSHHSTHLGWSGRPSERLRLPLPDGGTTTIPGIERHFEIRWGHTATVHP
jgi:hypothetical protein